MKLWIQIQWYTLNNNKQKFEEKKDRNDKIYIIHSADWQEKNERKKKEKQWVYVMMLVMCYAKKSLYRRKGNRTESTTLEKDTCTCNLSKYPLTKCNCSWANNAVWWNYFLVCLLVVCLVRRLKKQQHLNKNDALVKFFHFVSEEIMRLYAEQLILSKTTCFHSAFFFFKSNQTYMNEDNHLFQYLQEQKCFVVESYQAPNQFERNHLNFPIAKSYILLVDVLSFKNNFPSRFLRLEKISRINEMLNNPITQLTQALLKKKHVDWLTSYH